MMILADDSVATRVSWCSCLRSSQPIQCSLVPKTLKKICTFSARSFFFSQTGVYFCAAQRCCESVVFECRSVSLARSSRGETTHLQYRTIWNSIAKCNAHRSWCVCVLIFVCCVLSWFDLTVSWGMGRECGDVLLLMKTHNHHIMKHLCRKVVSK